MLPLPLEAARKARSGPSLSPPSHEVVTREGIDKEEALKTIERAEDKRQAKRKTAVAIAAVIQAGDLARLAPMTSAITTTLRPGSTRVKRLGDHRVALQHDPPGR